MTYISTCCNAVVRYGQAHPMLPGTVLVCSSCGQKVGEAPPENADLSPDRVRSVVWE